MDPTDSLAIDLRARYGRKAIEAGTPDLEQNDFETNAVDTIANVLHALAKDAVTEGVREGALWAYLGEKTGQALNHTLHELTEGATL